MAVLVEHQAHVTRNRVPWGQVGVLVRKRNFSGRARAATGEEGKTGDREDAERGNRTARRRWREDQFEQRLGIPEALLERTERTIPVIRGDEHAFSNERGDRQAEPAVSPTRESAPPDVADAYEKGRGDHSVGCPKYEGRWR